MRSGVIEQVGSPDELYSAPANRFVAGFIGSPMMNFLEAHEPDLVNVAQAIGRKPEELVAARSALEA